MSHEPECPDDFISNGYGLDVYACYCDILRAAYQRGYREGYNAHARSRAELESMFGPYVQHGKGENP